MNAKALKSLQVDIHRDTPAGEILASGRLRKHKDNCDTEMYALDFTPQAGPVNLCFVFRGKKEELLIFDSFSFR